MRTAYFVLGSDFLLTSAGMHDRRGLLITAIDGKMKKLRLKAESNQGRTASATYNIGRKYAVMGRYKTVKYLQGKRWSAGSPVMLNKGAVLKDTVTGNPYIAAAVYLPG